MMITDGSAPSGLNDIRSDGMEVRAGLIMHNKVFKQQLNFIHSEIRAAKKCHIPQVLTWSVIVESSIHLHSFIVYSVKGSVVLSQLPYFTFSAAPSDRIR